MEHTYYDGHQRSNPPGPLGPAWRFVTHLERSFPPADLEIWSGSNKTWFLRTWTGRLDLVANGTAYRTKAPLPNWHNPENVAPEALGDGWRFLVTSELAHPPLDTQISDLTRRLTTWQKRNAKPGSEAVHCWTYRTQAPLPKVPEVWDTSCCSTPDLNCSGQVLPEVPLSEKVKALETELAATRLKVTEANAAADIWKKGCIEAGKQRDQLQQDFNREHNLVAGLKSRLNTNEKDWALRYGGLERDLKSYQKQVEKSVEAAAWITAYASKTGLTIGDNLTIEGVAKLEAYVKGLEKKLEGPAFDGGEPKNVALLHQAVRYSRPRSLPGQKYLGVAEIFGMSVEDAVGLCNTFKVDPFETIYA